ncbi:MAG: DUF1622 domain-containing protein [Candidatus Gracilibacteria bacterium]|nr:DUF1622 domain-containing protein [Candidatus Gracilibacteria bacterium]
MTEELFTMAANESEHSLFLETLVSNSQEFAHLLSTLIGYIGLGVMIFGILYSLLLLAKEAFGKKVVMGEVRLSLGHYLVLALEFLVAKDILESIFDPNLTTLLELLLIVIIRTILTYFLNKELKEVKQEIKEEKRK